ncbi:unnamed protein product [Victoria cruziana]
MAAAGGIIAKRGWQYYHYQLQTNPLLTKAVTVGVLAGCSDSIAQKLSGIQKLQFKRLLLKVLYGFAYGGPFGHFFHKIMDIIFQGRKGNKTAAKKVLIEQLTSSPWNNVLFMIYYGVVVEGNDLKFDLKVENVLELWLQNNNLPLAFTSHSSRKDV